MAEFKNQTILKETGMCPTCGNFLNNCTCTEKRLTSEKEIIEEEAEDDLKEIGLKWEDLKDKTTLEIGAGSAALGRAAKYRGIKIVSLDKHPEHHTQYSRIKTKIPKDIPYVKADANDAPFREEAFDLIISLHSVPMMSTEVAFEFLRGGKRTKKEGIRKNIKDFFRISKKSESFHDEFARAKREEIKNVILGAKRMLKKGGEFRFASGPLSYEFFKDKGIFSEEEEIILLGARVSPEFSKAIGLHDDHNLSAYVGDNNVEKAKQVLKKLQESTLEFLKKIDQNITQETNEKGEIFYILRKPKK